MGGRDAKDGKLHGPRRGQRVARLKRSHRRLQCLYEVSTVLTSFRTVEESVPEVVELLARELPIRSAILILGGTGGSRTMTWQVSGDGAARLQVAREHAQAAYEYLSRSGVELERDQAAALPLPPAPAVTPGEEDFVVLPLVVARGPIFGAFQIDAEAPGELDLVFVNAVVNQLAIAVDRQAAIDAKQASAEAREKEQRLLADAGTAASSSLESHGAMAALARSLVLHFADLCVIDETGEDGAILHREVAVRDEATQPVLASRMRRLVPRPVLRETHAAVLASRRSRLAPGAADLVEEADQLPLWLQSLISVPLVARGKAFGVLTLAAVGSGRRYSEQDLAIAEELARRVAIAIDNAHLYEQAQRAMAARDDVLAIVSHDLKNPLGTILMGLSALLRGRDGDADERTRGRLERIQRSANRMQRMIDDLLETASIEAGRLSMELRRLDAVPLVSEAVDSLRPLAATRSQRLICELPPQLPAIQADGARLQQVLANLLGNAIKFSPEGGAIAIRARSSDDAVTFSVADAGPGIPPEDLPHLFDRFWQGGRKTRQGAGLGLFIVKGIVEAHGGKVWVESRVGRGSELFFTIPVVAAQAAEHAPLH